MKTILLIGTKDPIVGEAGFAQQTARDFPDIEIKVLESGHLIGVEKADTVNAAIRDFLNRHKD
jgi:pimeloyl-ACP methyl ester carboxylesterase